MPVNFDAVAGRDCQTKGDFGIESGWVSTNLGNIGVLKSDNNWLQSKQ